MFTLLNLYLFRCPLNMVHSLHLLVHVDVLTIFHPLLLVHTKVSNPPTIPAPLLLIYTKVSNPPTIPAPPIIRNLRVLQNVFVAIKLM